MTHDTSERKSTSLPQITLSARHVWAPRLVHPHRRVVRRLMTWLEAEGHGPAAGVKSVYFGHTHHPMELEYRGVWFHNGGGAIRGQKCQILRVQHRGEGSS